MTTKTVNAKNLSTAAIATKADTKVTKGALVDSIMQSAGKAYEMKADDQVAMRADIIKAAYTTAKADHALKNKVFVYYVKEIKRRGLTVEQILTFFKSEIEAQFQAKKLKETATDEETKEKVDAKAVYSAVRRMLTQAQDRYNTASGTNNKGADQNGDDPLAAIRGMFEKSSLVNIADAFWQMKNEKRKEDIIKALFDKLGSDAKAALYLELEAMQDGDA